jgi:hypothetical protein
MKQRFSRIVKAMAPVAMFAALTAFNPASAFAAPRGGHAGGGFAGGGRSFAAPARGFSGGHAVASRVYGGRYVGPGIYGPRIGLGFGIGAYPYGYAPYGYAVQYEYAAPYSYPGPYDNSAPYGYSAPAQTCNPAGYYDQNGVWQATPGCAVPQDSAAPYAPAAPAPNAP